MDYRQAFHDAMRALNQIEAYFEYSHESEKDKARVMDVINEFTEVLNNETETSNDH